MSPDAERGRAASPVAIAALVAFALALAVRLAFLLDASDSPFLRYRLIDEQDYDGLARKLAAGTWPGAEAVFRPPLYPVLLAVLYAGVGNDCLTIRAVQLGMGALAAPLTVLIGTRVLGSWKQGLGAGLVVAACGPLVFYDAQLLAASLDVLLCLCVVLLLLRANERRRALDWLLAGAVCGLSMCNRGSMMLVVPIVAAWAWWSREPGDRRDFARNTGAFVLASALVVAPLAWHNARNDERPEASYTHRTSVPSSHVASAGETLGRIVTGRFCALGWADGVNLYLGNSADALTLNSDAHVEHFDWFNELMTEPWRHGKTTAHEHSQWFKARAFEQIERSPSTWLRLLGRKALDAVNGYEIPRGINPYAEREHSPLLRVMLWDGPVRFPSGLIVPLGLVGLWLGRRDVGMRLLAGIVLAQLVFITAFFVTSRYRLPALPLLAVAATGLVARAAAAAREGAFRNGPWLLGAGAVLAAVVLANVRLTGQHLTRSAIEHYDVAEVLARDERGAEAIEHLEATLAIAPRFADAHVSLGLLHAATGRGDLALRDFRAALAVQPEHAGANQNLGRTLLEQGDLEGAEQAFRTAMKGDPGPVPRFSLGVTLLTKGDASGALRWLEEARSLGYADPRLPAMIDDARRRASTDP